MGSRIRDKVPHLFELFCEVAPGDHLEEPYIINKYPEVYNSDELKVIPKFTFPCKLDNSRVQHYSFVLTTADSEFTFGFCRYDNRANTSLVLLSFLPWHDIFNKLLNCIANLINSPKRDELKMFLEACRKRPMPGHTLEVTYNAGQSVFSCQNPGQKLPSIPENGNLTEYYSVVDAKCMAGLWAALLYERRIAIIATEPFRLSACVQAANGTLFPMSWQHIFIPILPKHVVEYLSAPMPYLIGVPRSVMETVNTAELGDIVILDIDDKKLKTKHDDLESLPHDLVSNLKKALERKNVLSSDAVSRAFLVALVSLIGGYRDSFKVKEGQHFTFDDERFVNSRKNMQPFLREILQTQIFRQFIERRLELLNSGKPSTDEFDVECNKYSNRLNTGRSQKLKDQYQDFAKNVKKEGGAFFKTVKNKANPAVQSVSKTVRRGGNNVKTAVKGLKNKLPKTGSRASSINTHDDTRISCGSVTPVSSSSSGSCSPPMPAPRPPRLDIDLLGDMNLYLDRTRRASLPDSSPDNVRLSAADKAKTLSPCLPPPVPDRPLPSFAPSYLVVPTTRNLLDLTDAPTPPPRPNAALGHRSGYTTNIIKDANGETEERTNTISFAKFGKDRTLKLTISSNESRLVNAPTFPPPPPPVANGGAPSRVPPPTPVASNLPSAALYSPSHGKPKRQNAVRYPKTVTETFGSDTDLIKLDDSPELEDFDPLKRMDKSDKVQEIKSSTDSALLHEYGLDFSQFGLLDYSGETSTSNVPKGWTTFN